MARNYQCKNGNPYLLPHDIYMRVKYTVEGYNRRKDEYEGILYESTLPLNGQPKSGRIADTTADKGIKRAMIFDELEAVDQALYEIPQEYRDGVRNNIMYHVWFPRDADVSTYRRYKQRYLYYVAKKLNLI